MIFFDNLARLLYISRLYGKDDNFRKQYELLSIVGRELSKPIDIPFKRGIIEDEKRYNHNHDPKTGKFTSAPIGGSGIDNSSESGIINSGATSGALNSESKAARKHASQYYESVRHMKTDTKRIAENTGIAQNKIEKIKQYVFISEHDLIDGHKRFAPSFEMAQSWQRLINGNFRKEDIILLKHEHLEMRYLERGFTQDQAHIKASKKYNYDKYSQERKD